MSRRGAIEETVAVAVVALAGVLLLAGGCWAYPQYKVYNKRLNGQAQLQEAESNRRITILEAQSKMESAEHLRRADSVRAVGVAQANTIIGRSLHSNPEYLTWLWIEALKENHSNVVYVPTEANLPILEAGRLGHLKK